MSGRTILIVTTATVLCAAGCSHQSPQNVTPIQSSRYLANNSQEIAQDRSALQEDDSVLARKRRELKREQDRLLTYERDQDATRKKLQAEQILPGDSSSEIAMTRAWPAWTERLPTSIVKSPGWSRSSNRCNGMSRRTRNT